MNSVSVSRGPSSGQVMDAFKLSIRIQLSFSGRFSRRPRRGTRVSLKSLKWRRQWILSNQGNTTESKWRGENAPTGHQISRYPQSSIRQNFDKMSRPASLFVGRGNHSGCQIH